MNQTYNNAANYLVSGKTFNEIAEAVNSVKLQMKQTGGKARFTHFQNGEVRVKYTGSSTLPVFSAVALTGLAIQPDNDDFVYEAQTFTGSLPTSSNADKPFAIVTDRTETGSMVKAVLLGVVPAKVTIKDSSAEYAIPTPGGSGALETSTTGTARIVWKAGSSGSQWCILQLGGGGSGSAEYNGYFKIVNTSTTDSSGQTVNKIKIVDGATYNSSTQTSGTSVCKVNNVVFNVNVFSANVTASKTYVLKYTAATQSGTAAKVEILAVDAMPSDDTTTAYYQIGRVIVSSGQMKIQQDHTAGVAVIYWYLLCSEDEA